MKVTVLKCPSCGAALDGNEEKCKFCRSTILFDGKRPETHKKKAIGDYFLEGLWHPGEDDKPWVLPEEGTL